MCLFEALDPQIRQEVTSLLDFEADVHARRALRQEIATPSGKYVGPSLDRVDIAAGFVRRKAPHPPVVVVQGHGNAEPFLPFAPPQQLSREHDLAIAEDVGPNLHLLADGAFDRKTAAVDEGIDVLDIDAMSREIADGADAGVRCHGSIVCCCPPGRQKPPRWNR